MNIDLYSILSQQDKDTVCDIVNETIAEHYGEDAMYRYSPRELFEKLEEISTSHEEYQNMLDCKDAAEVHELMNPAVCDV